MQTSILANVAAIALGMAVIGTVQAQKAASVPETQTLKRTILQTFDVPGTNYETVMGISEFGPNGSSGRQSHPGPESGYVLEGSGTILVDGQPPLTLKAGQSYKLAPGAIHDVRSGADKTKVLVIWVVEKGKPLASPAN